MPGVNPVAISAPVDWLRRGWADMLATNFRGSAYGLAFVLMGYAILLINDTFWQLTMALTASFLLMGPFVCSGLFDLSRQQENTGQASLVASLTCWMRNLGSTAFFAIILTFVMIVWARVSVILFALLSMTSFPTLQGVVQEIFSLGNPKFMMMWMGVGFVFASLVYAIGVVSMPMLLDRGSDTMMAIFTSVRTLFQNPGAMYLWALLIVAIIGLSLAAGFLPLIFTAPWIGHASWHAYRDLVQER